MKKKALIYVLLIIGTILFSTTNVYAKEEFNYENTNITIVSVTNINNVVISNNLTQIMNCSGQNAVLGNVNDPDSVAWLLQKLLDYTRVIGPFLVLVLSSIDYVKAILMSDDDSLNKAHKKLITRLLLAGSLFVLPTLVGVLLNVLGFTSHEVCGLQ